MKYIKSCIGKKCFIKDKGSIYYNEWGIIKDYDGEFYHVAIANGKNLSIFDRDQIRISRMKND